MICRRLLAVTKPMAEEPRTRRTIRGQKKSKRKRDQYWPRKQWWSRQRPGGPAGHRWRRRDGRGRRSRSDGTWAGSPATTTPCPRALHTAWWPLAAAPPYPCCGLPRVNTLGSPGLGRSAGGAGGGGGEGEEGRAWQHSSPRCVLCLFGALQRGVGTFHIAIIIIIIIIIINYLHLPLE